MMNTVVFSALLLGTAMLGARQVKGHGYLESPRSRNWFAHEDGIQGSQAGSPNTEYCHHCLNTNNGVCGKSTNFDYDQWIDSQGNPMPWISQGTYFEGEVISVKSYLSTHHNGHMEIKGCPDGRASTQECFDRPGNSLIFVEDPLYDMPADPDYPERGYYAGGNGGGIQSFEMLFRIPDGLVGSNVLLQWRYITANSCSPPGYADYFGGDNSDGVVLPGSYWNSGLGTCSLPYPQDGSRASAWPEQFFNCAEVTVLSAHPSSTRYPTPAPVEPSPVAPSPVAPSPTGGGGGDGYGSGCCSQNFKTCITWCGDSEDTCGSCNTADMFAWLPYGDLEGSCKPRWDDCTEDPYSCCAGLVCEEQDDYYSQCRAPATGGGGGGEPTSPVAPPPPTKSPTLRPVEQPSSSGGGGGGMCIAEWGECTPTKTTDSCCGGMTCVRFNEWYSQCLM